MLPLPGGPGATVWGYVTNVSGEPVVGTNVEAYKKTSDIAVAPLGRYELNFVDVKESPYSLIATKLEYEPYIVSPFYLFKGVTLQHDILLSRARGECNDDCTLIGTNYCSANCHGKGSCWFYDDETKAACEGTFGLTELPGGRYVDCCKGKPYVPLKAQVSVPGENVITTKSLVLYKGKFVNMVVVVFNK